MEQAQRLTEEWGAAAAGIHLCVFFSFPFYSFGLWSDFKLSFVSGDEG